MVGGLSGRSKFWGCTGALGVKMAVRGTKKPSVQKKVAEVLEDMYYVKIVFSEANKRIVIKGYRLLS